ncbi:MAG: hypothetical protein ACLTC3_08160 [Evtepia gabavorous]
MGVHEGHRDRMKREFLQGGLRHFSEPRVLELLLFYSRLQGDVNPWPTACWRPLAPCPAFWTPPPPTWPRSPAWGRTPWSS